jgi:delta-aminolevulinic acid dehydratase/porphobilinogen synthase
MTRKIMELSVAIFFLVLSVIFVFATVEISHLVRTLSDHYVVVLDDQTKKQNELYEAAKEVRTLISEGGFALSARAMEEKGLLSPSEANRIVDGALKEIKERSPRLGVIAESMNDAYLSR